MVPRWFWVAVAVVLLPSCGLVGGTPTPTSVRISQATPTSAAVAPTPTRAVPPATPTPSTVPTAPFKTEPATPAAARPTLIEVFFSRKPQSDNDFSAVFPVDRTVLAGSEERLAGVALERLIEGPTTAEQSAGYFSELGAMLRGPSDCDGRSFTLRMADGTATVRFCRTLSSAGVGQDARTQSQINATLKQFSSVRRVVLLTGDGHCLFDMSGLDLCLR